MRVLSIFPYPTEAIRTRVADGTAPDTYLMGLNHFGSEAKVDFLDPAITRTSDALWKFTRLSPIPERFFPANLLQQTAAIRVQQNYDALVIRDLKNVFIPAIGRRILKTRSFTLLLNCIVEGSGKYDLFVNPFLRGIDVMAYDSRAMSEVLSGRIGVGEEKLWYLPYCVDANFFSPGDSDNSEGIIGVGDTNRDYPTLLRALKKLRLRCKIFASRVLPLPGEKTFDLNTIASSAATVSFTDVGLLKGEYDRADLVVIPLHQTRTASGVTSLLEAMSMGKAVIIAGTAGILDYVEDGRTAMLYRPGDHLELGRQVDYLLEDENLRAEIGRQARRHVQRHFTTLKEGRRIEELLRGGVSTSFDT